MRVFKCPKCAREKPWKKTSHIIICPCCLEFMEVMNKPTKDLIFQNKGKETLKLESKGSWKTKNPKSKLNIKKEDEKDEM